MRGFYLGRGWGGGTDESRKEKEQQNHFLIPFHKALPSPHTEMLQTVILVIYLF